MLQSGYVTYLKYLKGRHTISNLEVWFSVPHKQIEFDMIDWQTLREYGLTSHKVICLWGYFY